MRASPGGPSLALRAIHLVPRLRRVADMCSSKESGIAQRERNGRPMAAPTVEKLLCRSFIVSVLKISPCFLRERGDSQEGGNRRCLPSCALRRVGEFRSLRKRKFHDLRRVIVFEQSHAVSRPHTAAAESRRTSALPYQDTGGPPAHQSQTAGRLDTASQYINR